MFNLYINNVLITESDLLEFPEGDEIIKCCQFHDDENLEAAERGEHIPLSAIGFNYKNVKCEARFDYSAGAPSVCL